MGATPPTGDVVVCEAIDDAQVASYAREGYALIFAEEVMLRNLDGDLPRVAPPEGIAIQPWIAERAPLFFAAYASSFADRPGFPGWTEERWVEWISGDPSFRADRSEVALTAEEPVGFIACSDDDEHPERGYIIQVGVVSAWRRRGLARALIARELLAWKAEGKSGALLHVNVNNPRAIGLYVGLGFVRVGRRGRFERNGEVR
jgi:mycothiol synthase